MTGRGQGSALTMTSWAVWVGPVTATPPLGSGGWGFLWPRPDGQGSLRCGRPLPRWRRSLWEPRPSSSAEGRGSARGAGPAADGRCTAAGTAACGNPRRRRSGRPSPRRAQKPPRGARVAARRSPPHHPRRRRAARGCWDPPGAPVSPSAPSCGASACWTPPSPPSCRGSPSPGR